MEWLYGRIGEKIKKLAYYSFLFVAIGAIITGFGFIIAWGIDDAWWAIFIILFGPIVAFVDSWLLYGFGELIDSNCETAMNTRNILKLQKQQEERSKKKYHNEIEEKVKHVSKKIADESNSEDSVAEKAQRENEKFEIKEEIVSTTKPVEKKENALKEKLVFALKYQTDEGMISYLSGIDHELVKSILSEPKHLIRDLVKKAIETL